ncbi:PAS domain-containing protein [Methylocystis parvus]|uniref:PAS domain-containing protein n=1 Tax=Methylocystis parvus TaxID=134 RepID=UPI003C70C299
MGPVIYGGRSMRQQVSKDLFAYWSELKGERLAPDRADIDPGAIKNILADTFILEVDAEAQFPLRLSGGRVNALWMREQKGRSFIEFWQPADRRSVGSAVTTVVDGVVPVVAGVKTYIEGHSLLELELLLLPLRHFGKTHSRVLGALSPVYQPEWLGQLRAGPLELISLRVIEAAHAPASASNVQPFPFAKSARSRPRLVVYDGDKL